MARKENTSRRLKGYYSFSKKYPSRRGERPIHETRRAKRRERTKKILLCVVLLCLFIGTFVLVKFLDNLSSRPLPDSAVDEIPFVTAENIGTVRAVYLENSVLDDNTEFNTELEKAKNNGFNAIMLDFKTREGVLTYGSDLISYSGSDECNTINKPIVEKIKDYGFMVVARVFCFEDSIAPQRLNAFVYENAEKTKIWFDNSAINGGKVWLDPTNSKSVNYLTKVIGEVVNMGADCVYLDSVQFPVAREGAVPVYTADDATLSRNLVLMQFLEKAVSSANGRPVILGVPAEATETGNSEKWGGTLFDTPAHICSPLLEAPSTGNFVEYIENSYIVMNDNAKNNFSTMKIIPTVKNSTENNDLYKNLSSSKAESYIIIP